MLFGWDVVQTIETEVNFFVIHFFYLPACLYLYLVFLFCESERKTQEMSVFKLTIKNSKVCRELAHFSQVTERKSYPKR